MPSSIDSVNQLVSLIRAQLSSRSDAVSTASRQNKRAPSSAKSDTAARSLQSLITQRIKAIDPNDSQRGRKAFRIFLESILLFHFGENLINDPQFYQMVDEIQTTMEADTDIRQQIDAAVQHLLSTN